MDSDNSRERVREIINKEKELVDKLIRGSAAIDKMKGEIDSTVRMILGFITPEEAKKFINPLGESFSPFYYEDPTCTWMVSKTHWGLAVHCVYGIGSFVDTIYSVQPGKSAKTLNHTQASKFDLGHVEIVHKNLYIFVNGMSKTFPKLEDNWQPLLDASDYAERNGW